MIPLHWAIYIVIHVIAGLALLPTLPGLQDGTLAVDEGALWWGLAPVVVANALYGLLVLVVPGERLGQVFPVDFDDAFGIGELIKTAALFTLILQRGDFLVKCETPSELHGCVSSSWFVRDDFICPYSESAYASSSCSEEQVEIICACVDDAIQVFWGLLTVWEIFCTVIGYVYLNNLPSENGKVQGFAAFFFAVICSVSSLAWSIFFLPFQSQRNLRLDFEVVGFFVTTYYIIAFLAFVRCYQNSKSGSRGGSGAAEFHESL